MAIKHKELSKSMTCSKCGGINLFFIGGARKTWGVCQPCKNEAAHRDMDDMSEIFDDGPLSLDLTPEMF